MKASILCVLLMLVASLSSVERTSASLRLDIAMEGPWVFYVQQNFKTGAGTSSVLIAVAPQVSGHHYPPVISAGDGGNFGMGVNCVVFDTVCIPKISTATALPHVGYADPSLVGLSQLGWNWNQYTSSAFVLILPMPDSISADGKEKLTFQKTLPTITSPNPPSTSPANYAIGLQLHYTNGPDTIGLYHCTDTLDASTCTQNVFSGDEDNSGTLRITIRNEEGSTIEEHCRYHVHGAYHAMLPLVDPSLKNNADKAYVDMATYDLGCTPGDPQQVPVPAVDASMHMMPTAVGLDYAFTATDISASLDTLAAYLRSLGLQHGLEEQIAVPELSHQAEQLRGKFPRLSDLTQLSANLTKSRDGINRLLPQTNLRSGITLQNSMSRKRNFDLAPQFNVALFKEQALQIEAQATALSIISGKDCRAALILVE